MELQCLTKVVKGCIRRLALTCNINFQCLRYKPTVFLPDNSGDLYFLHRHPISFEDSKVAV